MKYLLKNGTLVSGERTEKKDILIEGEKIVKIAPHIEEEMCIRDRTWSRRGVLGRADFQFDRWMCLFLYHACNGDAGAKK